MLTYADAISEMMDGFWDFDISGSVISSLTVMLIVALLAIVVGIKAHFADPLEKPHGILLIAEIFYVRVKNWADSIMGRDSGDWPGYFLCLFVYLFLSFTWSLTGFPSVIDYLIIPFTLSLVMFILIQVTALRYQRLSYFHRYIEPIPIWLPINLITMWSPIISTSLRMFGNALSGSVVIGLVNWALKNASLALFSFMGDAGQIVLGPLVIAVLNLYFGLFSGYVQTLVFCSLNAVWFSQEMPEQLMGVEAQATRGDNELQKAQ